MSDSSANHHPGLGCESNKNIVTKLSDPRNREKLFNEILSELISKRAASNVRSEAEPRVSEYRGNFSRAKDSKSDNYEQVMVQHILYE